jgi:hypothetical protein
MSTMTFSEFQESGRDVPDLRVFTHIGPQVESDVPLPGRVYTDHEFYIEGVPGNYCLTISNDSRSGAGLESMERALYDFAVSEGYIEA